MTTPARSSSLPGPRRRRAAQTFASLHVEVLESRELPCNTISGFVYHDANNNGRLESGETPLANISLELRNAQNVVVATAVTNAQGFYLFDRDLTIDTSPKTYVREATFQATTTDWQMSRAVEQFNPTLGTLTAVDVANTGSITSLIKAESLDNAARRITANVAGTLTLTGAGLTPVVANLSSQRFFDASAFDGTIDFRGTSGIDFGPQTAPGAGTQRLIDPAALALYAGAGNVTFTTIADANSSATGSGNLVSQITTTGQAQVSVTYTYTPNNCLRPGIYTIGERQPEGFLDGKDARDAEVLPNSANSDVIQVTLADRDLPNNNFGEVKPASIHGCVYLDANNNGVKESTETVMPNVAVRLTGTDDLGAVERALLTGPDGCYRFALLRPGTYAVDETQPTGFLDGKDTLGSVGGASLNDRHFDVVLAQGVDGVNYNFAELLPAGLGGCVYWDANNNGAKDSGEQPLPGVKITLTGTDDQGAGVAQELLTDDLGCYVFHTLRPGRYRVVETQPPGFISGKNSLGTAGGKVGDDEFYEIDLPPGVAARQYDFAERKPEVPFTPGPGYETTFSHTRLVLPGAQDVNLLSKLQFLATAGQNSLDANTLTAVIYVEGLYRTLLHRPADLGGLRVWVGQLLAGTSRVQVVQTIWNSPEHRGTQVDNLYATFLRRPADAAGRQAYVNALMKGTSEVDLARQFLKSSEFQAANASNADFVRALYQRVLGRAPDEGGLQGWTNALGTGVTRAQMVEMFIASREAYGRIVDSVYDNYLHRGPDGGGREAWLNALQRNQVTPQQFTIAVLASDEAFEKARKSARG